MPFDPAVPALNAELTSAMLRGQFVGLKDIIDAALGVTAVVVDGVTTLDPGQPVAVTAALVGTELHLSFAIPRGNEGPTGTPGADGLTGPPGPALAAVVVDAVNTLPAGSAATVSSTFDGTNVHLTLGIPAGFNGNDGATGAPGAPGEVTSAALATAISGTSSNANAVPTLDTPFTNDPPTLADMETMRAAHNALVLALRR